MPQMTELTFTASLPVPNDLCPTLPLYKPGSISNTLETVFETLVHCLPDVGLTEINSLFISPPLVSVPLDLASSEGPNLVFWRTQKPGALASLWPVYALCLQLSGKPTIGINTL